ncbi:coiled-coil domain-containing protein 171-like [Anomalospiza imberbis]|uniref:coiled-coil domain-containing protein 171-like n=2 Tax=Anomalospiza imberbis TaxID=187417 RepID=UPI00358E5D02
MANAHVLAKHSEVALEELPWTELCALLHENVEALILNFHKAKERISHLEYICKHKADTLKELQQKQEDAFEKMSEQLKAQEHCWQKEKQYLEEQYSNILAEVHARAQKCEETVQKTRQNLYGLEQTCEKQAHENSSMTNTLSNAHKARSSLLAACALLSGALCPLYGRLCAVSCQRDILQEQVNHHKLLNQKIISLLYALPTNVENSQGEGRLRQRRAKHLVYVFRRAVIAVLAANRLRALARYSCTFLVWTDASRGCTGIQVCVGESRGRHVSRFEEEGVDCIEALDWLTSSNLYTAIVSSISELDDVLSKQDACSWLSGHSLIRAARNCFAKLMDNLSILMETVQGKPCGCRAYLERDSLIQRLARGLRRVNAQALEAGLYDRLPSTRNIAILQQEIFEFSRRLHAAEVESHSLHLQLAECQWSCNEMRKDAEKAHRLQEQSNELQHKINQDNLQEELDNALQREQEARLLLQEHQRRLQELSSILESCPHIDTERSQVSNVSLMSLSNAMEELRSRDQDLDHQKRLLKGTEQDQQQLRETLEEAELALKQGVKDKELIINHTKAVEAVLNEAREQAVAPGAAAATPLPSLQLETLSEEAVRDRPEAMAFPHVPRHFMDLYSLAASKVTALTSGRESSKIHFEPLAVEPLTPAADGKSAFQAITVTGMWVPRQHLPSSCTASVGQCNNT